VPQLQNLKSGRFSFFSLRQRCFNSLSSSQVANFSVLASNLLL